MKIKVKEDVGYRISSAKSQSYRKGRTYENVPKSTAEKLIAAGKAEAVADGKPTAKE